MHMNIDCSNVLFDYEPEQVDTYTPHEPQRELQPWHRIGY